MTDAIAIEQVEKTCAFCARPAQLRESHVLPAFVFRWLRDRAGSGHMRTTENPNRRVQDGLKMPWLCGDCESLFSRYETAFANKIFHPWHSGSSRANYQDWLLKFCVSVSWRVLSYARGRNERDQYTNEQKALMDEAASRWRAFLRDEVPHPGPFEQHLLIADIIEESSIKELPNNINRFLTGAITLDIVGSRNCLMTFAKLGRFIIFGMIQKGSDSWQGTKIHVKNGTIRPTTYKVPAGILNLLIEKAKLVDAQFEKISPNQLAKIDKNVRDNLDRFAASDQFQSMLADARMFGDRAVTR